MIFLSSSRSLPFAPLCEHYFHFGLQFFLLSDVFPLFSNHAFFIKVHTNISHVFFSLLIPLFSRCFLFIFAYFLSLSFSPSRCVLAFVCTLTIVFVAAAAISVFLVSE